MAKPKFFHGEGGTGKWGWGLCYGIAEGFHHERSSWEGAELEPSLTIGDCVRSEFGFLQHRYECPLCVWKLKAQILGRVATMDSRDKGAHFMRILKIKL